MKKMSTYFKTVREPKYKVIDEVREENTWVESESIAYRKWDGTACAIINGKLYKRYDAKIGKDGNRKIPPANSIACQEPDEVTGHQPYWTPVLNNNKADRRMLEAFTDQSDGTYEFCGPKVGGNPEGLTKHKLIPHTYEELTDITDYSFEGLKKYLSEHNIEGIVFWNTTDERKCKIRKTDYTLTRI